VDLQSIKLFAEYNKKVNIEMNKIISELSHVQWEKQFKGYFNSIKSMCNHIYICDFNWLKRFSNLRQFKYIRNGVRSLQYWGGDAGGAMAEPPAI
jgi:uncharacterized damage-inducible protein DinB